MAASRNLPPDPLREAVSACLAAHLPTGMTIHLGLSGGRDSVVLLHCLKSLFTARVRAIHVQHGLSPNEGDWARFCANLCREWGIPLEIAKVTARRAGKGLEAAARTVRYLALREHGAVYLALAHHRRDQAETLLLNLFRGAGVAGAAAMRHKREMCGMTVLRPLLDVGEAEIAAYAKAHGLVWVEDESNEETHFRRNFLRLEVLPRLSAVFPAVEANLSRAAGHFAEAQTLLHDLAVLDAARIEENAKYFAELSPARQANWLRWYLKSAGWGMPDTARLMDALRQLSHAIRQGRPCELSLPGGRLNLRRGRFFLVADEDKGGQTRVRGNAM